MSAATVGLGLAAALAADRCCRQDPIQRQLLGDSANIKGFWQPTEEDVPLKGFIERHAEGKHAVRSPQIFASTGQQGDIEGHYKPILGEWGKQRL